jgi:hypothetical protein
MALVFMAESFPVSGALHIIHFSGIHINTFEVIAGAAALRISRNSLQKREIRFAATPVALCAVLVVVLRFGRNDKTRS